MSDPQKYRSKEELAEVQEQDCINRMVNFLIDRKLATQQQIDQLDQQARQRARDAVKFAGASPDTGLEELYTDVYADPYPPYRRGEPT